MEYTLLLGKNKRKKWSRKVKRDYGLRLCYRLLEWSYLDGCNPEDIENSIVRYDYKDFDIDVLLKKIESKMRYYKNLNDRLIMKWKVIIMKKDFVAQWWQKDCSIVGLFNEIIKNNKTVNYIKIKDETLILIFHKLFEMKVVFSRGYFNTYINDKFDYNIEEQDICEYIEEIINDKYVFIE